MGKCFGFKQHFVTTFKCLTQKFMILVYLGIFCFCILDHVCSQLNIFILTLQTSLSWCLGPSLNSHSTYQIIGTMLYVADLQT